MSIRLPKLWIKHELYGGDRGAWLIVRDPYAGSRRVYTVYRISLRFGITMSELIAANGMTPATMNTISVGQELIIPRTAVTAPTAAPVVPTATPLPTLAPQPTQPVANVG